MIQSLKCAYPWVNEIFIEIQWYLTIFYYLWLNSISRASKIYSHFFFSHLFLLLFCSFAPTYVLFLFLFNFFHIFSFFFFFFFFFVFGYFQTFQFSLTQTLFFWKLSIDSIETIKPKRSHFGINLYLSVCSYFMGLFIYVFCVSIFTIYLCHLHQPVLGFFFFLSFFLIFSIFVWIFSNFSLKHKLSITYFQKFSLFIFK